MNRLLPLIMLFLGIVTNRLGENYIYCEELTRFKNIILRNSLDVLPYILRRILCVRRKSSDIKGIRALTENNINNRNYSNKYYTEKQVHNVDSGLYLYFEYQNRSQPFYLPKGFINIKNISIDFKVILKETLSRDYLQLQKF